MGLPLTKVGVVGAGTMGRAIAWHMAKALASQGVSVVLVDISQDALSNAARWFDELTDSLASKKPKPALSSEAAEAMKRNTHFTTEYPALAGAQLVIEAATEDPKIKLQIFKQLEEICGASTVLGTNTSHIPWRNLGPQLQTSQRFFVLHHFNPAERSEVVEVVGLPGAQHDALIQFLQSIGRITIPVKDCWGFAGNRVFEGICLAALFCVERGLGTEREVDYVAREALGTKIGPLAVLNPEVTGGNALVVAGLTRMHTEFMGWCRIPALLTQRGKERWDVVGRSDAPPEIEPERKRRIIDALRGAYLGLAALVVEKGTCSWANMQILCEYALAATPPLDMIEQIGLQEAARLVHEYAREHTDFQVAEMFGTTRKDPYLPHAPQVVLTKVTHVPEGAQTSRGVAILQIRNPRKLNPLTEKVYRELLWMLPMLEHDPDVSCIIITGYGPKAAIAGADLRQLHEIVNGPDARNGAMARSALGQQVGRTLEGMKKLTAFAINGLCLGGGLELAMACKIRTAATGIKQLGLPETTLGILPGAGGTQRLVRWVKSPVWAIEKIRLGKFFSSEEAHQQGLISELFPWEELIPGTIELMDRVLDGGMRIIPIRTEPFRTVPETFEPLDGVFSGTTDEIVCQVIRDGMRLPHPEGLRVENEGFGDVAATDDARRGIANFLAR